MTMRIIEMLKAHTVQDFDTAIDFAKSQVYHADGLASVQRNGDTLIIRTTTDYDTLVGLVVHAGLYPLKVIGVTDGRKTTSWRYATPEEQARFVELDM